METSEGQTWYEKAKSAINNGDQSATSQMYNAVTQLISGLISFAFIFGVISQLNIILLILLVVFSVILYFLKIFAHNREEKLWNMFGDLRKKRGYMERAMADTTAAKDIRVYNLKFLFDNINNNLLKRTFDYLTKVKNGYFLAQTIRLLLTIIRDGGAYGYCIWQVVNKNITVPEFVLYMSAITVFSEWANNIINNFITLKRENVRLNHLRSFFEYTNKFDPENPPPISTLTQPVEIEFKNVGFRYTKDTPKILDGLSFKIGVNEKAALVGLNGAWKTTIVKLLCEFYKVMEGDIN
jgi:ABC-type multidrug transport system fused ATPase/permease subunit